METLYANCYCFYSHRIPAELKSIPRAEDTEHHLFMHCAVLRTYARVPVHAFMHSLHDSAHLSGEERSPLSPEWPRLGPSPTIQLLGDIANHPSSTYGTKMKIDVGSKRR